MSFKFIFAVLSSIVAVSCFIPYIIDIFKGTTKPHSYTWLIWTILQTVGVVAMIKGGAGIGVSSLVIGAVLCGFVFILSLFYGTHNIKIFDKICLIGAFMAIGIYIFLHSALFSVMIVVITDLIGFLPTIRKTYDEPYTETTLTYILSSLSSLFALGALSIFTFTTSFYLISLVITNMVCAIVIILRRKFKFTEKIKLICFDLDDTLITDNSWKRLNFALGISAEEDRQMYKNYKSGVFSYDDWNDEVLKYYLKHKDATKTAITEILSKYEYNKGSREIVDYLKNKGYEIVLISGSINIMVSIVAHDLGIKYFKANNDFIFDDEGRLVSIDSSGNDTKAKLVHLESFCELLNISIDECACVGDGENDLALFEKTGHGITFKGQKIEKYAWKTVVSLDDIKDIL